MAQSNLKDLYVTEDTPLLEVIKCIDRSGRLSMALLTDASGRLLATITDGDIRRGIMAGSRLDAPLREILPIKARLPNHRPVTAKAGTDHETLLDIMRDRRVRQLPLVDA